MARRIGGDAAGRLRRGDRVLRHPCAGARVRTTWCGFLKIIVNTVPEVADIFGIPRGAPFCAMLFGNPAVDYVRCVDRSSASKVVYR